MWELWCCRSVLHVPSLLMWESMLIPPQLGEGSGPQRGATIGLYWSLRMRPARGDLSPWNGVKGSGQLRLSLLLNRGAGSHLQRTLQVGGGTGPSSKGSQGCGRRVPRSEGAAGREPSAQAQLACP